MTALILSLFLLFGASAAADVPASPWVVLVYDCDRPVGIVINTDPPQWLPADGNMTPEQVDLISLSITAERAARLVVGHNCQGKLKT